MSDNSIIVCEKCGEAQGSTAHLARHLRDMHGWQATLAIQLAKEMRSRYQDADERIRRAAPDLLAVCDEAHQLLWHYELVRQENGVDWGPVDELRQKMLDRLASAITKAREG